MDLNSQTNTSQSCRLLFDQLIDIFPKWISRRDSFLKDVKIPKNQTNNPVMHTENLKINDWAKQTNT